MTAIENMPQIRALQPDGAPTRAAIWQACFNEPMPDGLDGKSPLEFSSAVYDRLERIFGEASGHDIAKTSDGMTAFSSGMKMQKALDSMSGPVTLSLDDYVVPPSLPPLSQLPPLAKCEETLAKDLYRRGSHQPIKGYDPVITFGAAGQPAETVHIQDVSDLNDQEKADYYGDKPSPISQGLIARARTLCGGSDAQLRQVVLNMSQAGTMLLRISTAAVGTYVDEHSPVDIDVRGQADGSVTMRFHTPDNSPVDVEYTCTVAPDGRASVTGLHMVQRPDAPPAPPAPGESVPPGATVAPAAAETTEASTAPAAPAAG